MEIDSKINFSTKFYFSIVLIIFSFIIGHIAKLLFFIYFTDSQLRNFCLVIYILSWLMLFFGVWLAGKDYYLQKIKPFLSYRFYHNSIKNKTKQAYGLTKAGTKKLREEAKKRTV